MEDYTIYPEDDEANWATCTKCIICPFDAAEWGTPCGHCDSGKVFVDPRFS